MIFLKHLMLFITNYSKELQRKWKSLPLLLLYPIILLALISVIIITLITPPEDEPIQVGLIDLDQTEETQLVVDLLDQSSQLGSYIQVHKMTKKTAIDALKKNELSAYVTFPQNFTNHLYEGTQVELAIVGNPDKQVDSLLVKEFIDSITRHIRTSQANILAIDHYAAKLGLDPQTRNDLLFEQFTDFFLYTIDKDRSLLERETTNYVTKSPLHYFSIGSWFIVYTIWLMSFFTLLYQEHTPLMSQRLSLYGVSYIQKVIARMIVTLVISTSFATGLFYLLQLYVPFHLFFADYMRLSVIVGLYSCFYLLSLGIIELIFPSHRSRLFVQATYTATIIILSGAIVPSMYLPFKIQPLLPYIFSYEAFYWVQELLLNERLFAQYFPLIVMNGVALSLLIGFSLWKERMKE